jgi:hypothetical protein
MHHIDEGQLRAYHDHELSDLDRERVEAHLVACAECQQQAEALAARAVSANQRLAALAPRPPEAPVPVGVARARLGARISESEKEKTTMWNKIFGRRYQPAWATLGAVMILAALLIAFPPVRALAIDFLGLFRVQRIAVVPINPANLPKDIEGSSTPIEQFLSDEVQVEKLGEPQQVTSAEEASALAGIPVRLPAALEGKPRLSFQPGSRLTSEVDLPRVRALLEGIGRSDISLPDELDGATVTAELPPSITAAYGECDFGEEAAQEAPPDPDRHLRNCTVLVQLTSPSVSAPPGLDIAQLGEAYLQVLGLTPEEAHRFSQTVDWSTTLVVPIPQYGRTSYHDVQVDGVTGVLIQQVFEERNAQYMLMWIKGDILYALAGPGDGESALEIANSLK